MHVSSARHAVPASGPAKASATSAAQPMTFEEAKAAAATLGTWVRARVEAQDTGGQDLNDAQMREVFGPPRKQSELPPQATLGVITLEPTHFFYARTAVDLATGDVYSQRGHSMGSYYGPLTPPPEARITGDFTLGQQRELASIMARAARQWPV